MAGDVGADSSDSSDDFDVANAPEESDDDIDLDPSTGGKSEEWRPSKTIADSKVNKTSLAEREADILSMQQVGSKKGRGRGLAFATQPLMTTQPLMNMPPAAPIPGVGAPIQMQMGPRKRGRPRKSLVDPNGNVINNGPAIKRGPAIKHGLAIKQSATPALAYKTGYSNGSELTGEEARRQQTRQHYEQYIAYRGRGLPIQAQAQTQMQTQMQTQAPTGFEYVSRLTSEAQVRVALDYVAHTQGNVSMKERHIAALFHRLEEVRIQGGIAQS